jgi:dienelactone hydrolase
MKIHSFASILLLTLPSCSASSTDPSPGAGGATGAGASGGRSPISVGGAGGGGTAPAEGCTSLLPLPTSPAERGPWDVGVRTVTIGRLTVEVAYPAEPGTTADLPETTYDVRDWLPARERSKVPDESSPAVGPIGGHLYRDVPIDATYGPFPVVVMIHGTASFRIASGSTMVHWASRGFVVLAADYPGMFLMDQLADTTECSLPITGDQDVPGDVHAQLQAIQSPSGALSFLAGRVDPARVGITGHSQGACITAMLTNEPGVKIIMPLTGSTFVTPSPTLESILWVVGIEDQVIGYDSALFGNFVCPDNPTAAVSNVAAYTAAPGLPVRKRFAGIAGGGHLVMTDLCQTNAQGRNAVEQAQFSGVCGIDQAAYIGLTQIFDCGTLPMADGIYAVNYATTAALEETLHCMNRDDAFAAIQTAVPAIADFRDP